MESKNIVPLLLVAGIVLAVVLILKKREAAAATTASAQPNAYVSTVNAAKNGTSSVIEKVPYAGKYIDRVANGPVNYVTSGDWQGATESFLTGGATTIFGIGI